MDPNIIPSSSSVSKGDQNEFFTLTGPQKVPGERPSNSEVSGDLPPSELVVETVRMNRNPIEITSDLEAHVKKLYGTESDLPYHGWHHIEATRKEAAILVERCKKAGVEVDEVTLDHAIICHDLLYSVDPKMFRFKSREELAAHYAYNLLRFYGADEEHARKVERIILATNFLVEPSGVEEMLMRAADLKNLGGSYSEFHGNTVKLWEEAKRLSGEEISFEDHVKRTLRFLPLYVWRFLRLTNDALNERGASAWHEKTLSNLIGIFSEINSGRDNIRVVAQVSLASCEPIILAKRLPGNTFFIAVDPESSALEEGLRCARIAHPVENGNGKDTFIPAEIPAYFVPGKVDSLPIADAICDEVYVPSTAALHVEELARVLKPNGDLVIDVTNRGDNLKLNHNEILTAGFSHLAIDGSCYRYVRNQ